MSFAATASLNTPAPPKQPAMSEHAQKLHNQAEHLATCNGRLTGILERLHGPQPEGTSSSTDKIQPAPQGVLYVAQFGAEKIGVEIDRLQSLISRLEQVA